MAKHVGIAACSAEGAALCYRTLCGEAGELMGEHRHPEVSMHTHPLADYMGHIRAGAWGEVARLMVSSSKKLAAAGAEFVVCPDNTIHQAFEEVVKGSSIPWLHIAEVVAEQARSAGYQKPAVTGTKYLMTGTVYPEALKKWGISCAIPGEKEREEIDRIIFSELVNGEFKEESRWYFNRIIQKLKEKGCDAVVLGCTEIPLLVDPEDSSLPVLDSTRLLARAAIREAMS